jgi:hypothetical protein
LNAPVPVAPGSKVYDTPEGFTLARKILAQTLPFEPHDFHVAREGIWAVLDGLDLLVTMVAGSGKTGFFILVMRSISEDDSDARW